MSNLNEIKSALYETINYIAYKSKVRPTNYGRPQLENEFATLLEEYILLVAGGDGGAATFTTGTVLPTSPKVKDLFYHTTEEILYIYIDDGTSELWMDISAAVGGGGEGAVLSVNGETGIVVLDSDGIAEGTTNLYNKLITGGTAGQSLVKIDGTDYNTQWATVLTAVNWGDIEGTLSNQTDLATALSNKIETSLMGATNGVATLDGGGKVPANQLNEGTDEVVVNDPETDLNIVAGEYLLEDGKKYRAGQDFTLARNFNVDNIATGCVFDFQSSTILYAGTGALMQGSNDGIVRFKDVAFIATAGQEAMALTGNLANPNSVLIIDDCGFLNFSSLGTISNYAGINVNLVSFGVSVNTRGLAISDCNSADVNGCLNTNFVGSSNSPFMHFNGAFQNIQIRAGLPTTQSGESFISFSPDFTHTGNATTQGNAFNDSLGGVFFDAGHSGSVTTFADAGGGITTVTTSVAHDITTQQKVVIAGTTNYNGTFTITNAVGSTFDIDTAFVLNDATGTFDTGDSNSFFNTNNMPFQSNGDQQDSKPVAKVISVAPITVTILAIDTPVDIAGINADWLGEITDFFEINTDGSGTVRYTGDSMMSFRLSARVTVSPLPRLLTVYLAKNGTTLTSSKWTGDATKGATFNPEDIVTLTPGDYLNLQVENNEGSQNVTGLFANINVIPA